MFLNTIPVFEALEINFTKEDEELLVSALIKKVNKFATNTIKLNDFMLPKTNISSLDICFNRANEVVKKCFVLCTICDVKTACIFNKTWQVSNFEKHLKDCYLKHFEKGAETTVNLAASSIANSVPTTPEKSNVVKPVQENEEDLSALLNNTNDERDVIYMQLNESLQNALTIMKK